MLTLVALLQPRLSVCSGFVMSLKLRHAALKMTSLALVPVLLTVAVIISSAVGNTSDEVCHRSTTFPHRSVLIPGSQPVNTQVDLHMYYPCDTHEGTATYDPRPLVLLRPSAFLPPQDYSQLTETLVHLGFVVALPDNTVRDLPDITRDNPFFAAHFEKIAMFEQCPNNGQLVTTSISSRYVSAAPHLFLTYPGVFACDTDIVKHSVDIRVLSLYSTRFICSKCPQIPEGPSSSSQHSGDLQCAQDCHIRPCIRCKYCARAFQ